MSPPPIFFISGAFGTGKTTVAPLVAARLPECFVMDADWLINQLSRLAGRELHIDAGTLPDVWLAIAGVAAMGHRSTVIFSPCEPREIENLSSRALVGESHWLLLDCADELIDARLAKRSGWTEELTHESLIDAAHLRTLRLPTLHTDKAPPEITADEIVAWVRERLA